MSQQPAGSPQGGDSELDDSTIVAPSRAAVPTESEQTVVVQRQMGSDETVVAERPERDAEATRKAATQRPRGRGSRSSGPAAPPVPEPSSEPSEWLGRRLSAANAAVGLDPERPIAVAPGTTVWDHVPTGVGGVSQGLPVAYGPRGPIQGAYTVGLDEVQRQLGPAPAGYAVQVREGREQLPSLRRQAARTRIVTLAMYAVVLGVSVLGLYGVTKLAFGW